MQLLRVDLFFMRSLPLVQFENIVVHLSLLSRQRGYLSNRVFDFKQIDRSTYYSWNFQLGPCFLGSKICSLLPN